MSVQPFKILIFDSGVGGLSIYHSLQFELTHTNHYLYFADHKAAPYGNKDDNWLNDHLHKLLTSLNNSYSPDVIIIACNTASTLSLETLRKSIATPIIGVVPAIKTAALLANEQGENMIGLLATPATIQREYIKHLTEQFAQNLTLHSVGSTELVTQAEQKLNGNKVDLAVLSNVIKPLLDCKCRFVVLGCTHFPLLKNELEQIAPDIHWIDSGQAIAKRAAEIKRLHSHKDLSMNVLARSNYSTQFISSGQIEKGLQQYLNKTGFSSITTI